MIILTFYVTVEKYTEHLTLSSTWSGTLTISLKWLSKCLCKHSREKWGHTTTIEPSILFTMWYQQSRKIIGLKPIILWTVMCTAEPALSHLTQLELSENDKAILVGSEAWLFKANFERTTDDFEVCVDPMIWKWLESMDFIKEVWYRLIQFEN